MTHDSLIAAGRYRARFATGPGDVRAAQALRARVFRGDSAARDGDDFDPICRHVLIEEIATGALVGAFRLLGVSDGSRIGESYSAQFYRLTALEAYRGPMAEVGRFCTAPGAGAGDVLRLAWGALTRIVDDEGITMLFGCSSFSGTDTRQYLDAFAFLKERHIAPSQWRPGVKAPDVFRFGTRLRRKPDPKRALKAMPPLLRTYLMMGGWVSDHAVVDRDLGTLHVFTGLEIGAVPAERRKALRAMVGA